MIRRVILGGVVLSVAEGCIDAEGMLYDALLGDVSLVDVVAGVLKLLLYAV